MYELIIKCLECKTDKSEDDLTQPANLTKDQVIEQAEHLEECDVPDFDVGMLDVRNKVLNEITTYTIQALRQ